MIILQDDTTGNAEKRNKAAYARCSVVTAQKLLD